MTLEETLEKIHPANQAAMAASLEHWSNIAMPLHSLGRLQDTVVRIAGMTGDPRVDLKKKALVVMCADNGVVEEGVTQSGPGSDEDRSRELSERKGYGKHPL